MSLQQKSSAIHFFTQEADVLKEVTSKDLVAAAFANGECNSVRQLLRKQGLDDKVKTALRRMEIVQRRADGSDASCLLNLGS